MPANRESIPFKIDNRAVDARPEETILQAARRANVSIPHLCYTDGLRPDGNCRACVVEIQGERVLAPACARRVQRDMEVRTQTDRVRRAQRLVLELLESDMPADDYKRDSELTRWSRHLGAARSRFDARRQPSADLSHPGIAVNLSACIQCTRCVRACREEQANDVIGYAFRGAHAKIVFDFDDAMGSSSCVGCGECVQVCPTGALMPAGVGASDAPQRSTETVCPYCGVGCLLTYHVKDNRILYADGRDGPSNHGRLCVKGRFGYDYVKHPHRLTHPLIRRPGKSKSPEPNVDPANPFDTFREATWEEALDVAAAGLRRLRDANGPAALAGFGCAKGTNEEAYLFQKLVRTAFGTNNVDHCTRLCHASSVVALLEMIGSGAVSNQVEDVAAADVIVIVGANPTENHPVAATFIKNAVRSGKTLIVMDPRRTEIARHARHYLQFRADTDVALLSAMIHAIIDEDLIDARFIEERTRGFDELRARVASFSPEAMALVCGIPADVIRQVARVYAKAKAAIIFWGMGVSQHVHGTDNARCLISLSLITGQIGRPGTGLHPLRGQNNVQGASDAGLIPMVFPDYQRVDVPEIRERFEQLWRCSLDPKPGLTVVEIMHAIHAGDIRGMYIMGENPAMSDPNLAHARRALTKLEHLVVQDIFLTETAMMADVVLPASAAPEKSGTFTNTDRRVQLGRQALEPPGDARQDLWIIQELARRLGCDWSYRGPRDVFEEMRVAMPSIAGITWERLEREHSVTYPCRNVGDAGEPVLFQDTFPMPDGRARLVPVDLVTAAEVPDADYPYVLITGRQLEHWHTGAMTRRATVLDAIEPSPVVSLHPDDLAGIGVQPGETVTVESRRGAVSAFARADDSVPRRTLFLPFCYVEAAANLLTNDALDPYAKIPEYKYCGVRVRAGDTSLDR